MDGYVDLHAYSSSEEESDSTPAIGFLSSMRQSDRPAAEAPSAGRSPNTSSSLLAELSNRLQSRRQSKSGKQGSQDLVDPKKQPVGNGGEEPYDDACAAPRPPNGSTSTDSGYDCSSKSLKEVETTMT